jgi:hypothetical protein
MLFWVIIVEVRAHIIIYSWKGAEFMVWIRKIFIGKYDSPQQH